MIGSFSSFSIKESKKQWQQSLSKSSMYTVYSYFSEAATTLEVFCTKAIHEKFVIFTGKQLCWSHF